MPRLLDQMPFPEEAGEVVFNGERVRVRANQIIAWASLTLRRVLSPDPRAVPFPIILDTGQSHSFSIQARHLVEWAGIEIETLPQLSHVRDRDRDVTLPLRAANIWIHANERGVRDRLADRPPYLVEATRGIAVYPEGNFPRLPLLGLRAIAENGLLLKVDGARREVTLRTAYKWWPFS